MAVHLHYLLLDKFGGEDLFMSDLDFGELIRERRKELDLDQSEAAMKAGLTLYTYGRIERNEVTPRLDQVTKIFGAFGLSLGQITEETSKPEKLTIRDCLNNIEYYTKELRRLVGQ